MAWRMKWLGLAESATGAAGVVFFVGEDMGQILGRRLLVLRWAGVRLDCGGASANELAARRKCLIFKRSLRTDTAFTCQGVVCIALCFV